MPRAVTPQPGALTPQRLARTGGGRQLLVAQAPGARSTRGTLSWWERRGPGWHRVGTAPARFGAGGLVEGRRRRQSTSTTPTGLFDLPYAFGSRRPPAGTRMPYRAVTPRSWWCEDPGSPSYNRWVEPLPRDCAAADAERLAGFPTQYARALVVGFNYRRPVRGRGAGIFLHVNGRGATAGCVSVPGGALARLLTWLRPAARPHLVIGTAAGPLAPARRTGRR
ncbi:L,D-transpeptidase [Streptomyces sp. NPDC059740]|uniref:L,D-transpeptidase family protein n=1 Tax=Streptomyces sp. NPDC059740 TaxID=3346926 RepID=UPI003648FAED